jgi:L-2-hydroxyglutarate oxidase LhgO
LHAGFYYSPDSLKAKFCLDGNIELKQLIHSYNLPIKNCGKVVVAKNAEDLPRMQTLFERGMANGVNLFKFPASKLVEFEPLSRTYQEFLWSPDTSVGNPILVGKLIEQLFIGAGGEIRFGSKIEIRNGQDLYLGEDKLDAEQIINASGSYAIHFAHQLESGLHFSQLPVLGRYKITNSKELPLRTLVYPVPNPKNPFLGVHFTLTVDGDVKIGPTAIPVLGREQYEITEIPDVSDLKSSAYSIMSLMKSSPEGLLSLAATELPKISTKRLIREGQELVPMVNAGMNWKKKKPGMRAQLVNLRTNSFEMDFVVEKKGKFTHILNAVSPGWTSAIPFSKYVVEKYLT